MQSIKEPNLPGGGGTLKQFIVSKTHGMHKMPRFSIKYGFKQQEANARKTKITNCLATLIIR